MHTSYIYFAESGQLSGNKVKKKQKTILTSKYLGFCKKHIDNKRKTDKQPARKTKKMVIRYLYGVE